jgi:hypothetical protein
VLFAGEVDQREGGWRCQQEERSPSKLGKLLSDSWVLFKGSAAAEVIQDKLFRV